jgi:hypothetical protein
VSGLPDGDPRISSLQNQLANFSSKFRSTIQQLTSHQQATDENYQSLFRLLCASLSLREASTPDSASSRDTPVASEPPKSPNPASNQLVATADLQSVDPAGMQFYAPGTEDNPHSAQVLTGGPQWTAGHGS